MDKQVGLQEYLDNSIQPEEHFIIDNDEKTNWALRKIKAKKEQQTANYKLAAREILKIQEWLKNVNEPLQNDIELFENMLEAYALLKRTTDPKYKSQKLPEGSIRFKKQQPEYIKEDKSLVNFLESNGFEQFVKTEKNPVWGEFKKETEVKDGKLIHKETGLVVDVVGVVEREEKFEVVV